MDETSISPHISQALSRVAARRQDVDKALLLEAMAVWTAREQGATWERIGSVYAISKQAAQQRWSQRPTGTRPDMVGNHPISSWSDGHVA